MHSLLRQLLRASMLQKRFFSFHLNLSVIKNIFTQSLTCTCPVSKKMKMINPGLTEVNQSLGKKILFNFRLTG